MSASTLGTLLYAFFQEHLKTQKGLSAATIKSYRDALRLFLLFVARDRRGRITRIQVEDLTAVRVRQFLITLETERHNYIRSRSQRLTALKTFFDHLAVQVPGMLAEAERVMAIPVKRAPPPPTLFLERDEIQHLFSVQTKTLKSEKRRRNKIKLFLYKSISETEYNIKKFKLKDILYKKYYRLRNSKTHLSYKL
jgi:site-specific recombinase XerD